ncbi:FHA domain-containing protein [Streptomyces sp. KLOTTS4A1]|uniref:FHA domain-containing protein n=1 Tax=Streptomyces sp. KLOTTS4A1 TaxID=3390996 RepID=UPI0039F4B55C
MESIIVVPGEPARQDSRITLGPGDTLGFGRGEQPPGGPGTDAWLSIPHPSVSRTAGVLTASSTHWSLSNLSTTATYVVDNPEGAGEHVKVAPGRLGAPMPFEFSRVVLPSSGGLLGFDVWAPRHDYAQDPQDGSAISGESTALAFPLDRSKRYFLVLAALCEDRLRGEPHASAPTVAQLTERLRKVWPQATRSAVQWNIDYLSVKLQLRPGPEDSDPARRLHGKKEALMSLALRFDLVSEDDLALLSGPASS